MNCFNEEKPILTKQNKEIKLIRLDPDVEEETLKEWAESILKNYEPDDEKLEKESKPFSSIQDYLKNVLPDPNNKIGCSTMAGDFTEILVADYLQYVQKFCVPRIRYQEKTYKNMSPKGSDVIGYKIISKKASKTDELLVLEVKSKTSETKDSESKSLLKKAVDDSAKDVRDIHNSKETCRLSATIIYTYRKLIALHQDHEAEIVERFINKTDNPYRERYGAAAVYSEFAYKSISLNKLELDTTKFPKDQVYLLVIHCNQLLDFIKKMYERAKNVDR